jgi:hypothetical protein
LSRETIDDEKEHKGTSEVIKDPIDRAFEIINEVLESSKQKDIDGPRRKRFIKYLPMLCSKYVGINSLR